MTNTRDTPIEAIERSIPVRMRVYKLREGSGGAGAGPGGEGIRRELEFLEPTTVSLICERQTSRPWVVGSKGSRSATAGTTVTAGQHRAAASNDRAPFEEPLTETPSVPAARRAA